MEINHCLYQIVNTLNGMIYIGMHSTNKLFDNYMGSGKEIKLALKEFGKENFIKYIIGLYDTRYDLISAEIRIVDKEFVLREDTYNIRTGSDGGIIFGYKRSEETKRKMSIAFTGRIYSEEAKRSMSNAQKLWHQENKVSQQTRETISKSLMGREFSEEWKNNICFALLGVQHTEERKKNISIACKNKTKRICPHCGKECNPGNAERWHFDNCKFR